MTFASDNSYSIGKTPLVKLNRLVAGSRATVLAKIEGRNPAYSVKCRIGANMIWQAEKDGKLKPGGEIIEPTSGNTGIALAFVAAARGYRLTVTMPESMSLERRKVLTLLGDPRGAHAGGQGDERRRGQGRRTGGCRIRQPSCLSNSRIPPTRTSISRPPVPRSGKTRKARSTYWCAASAPAGPSPASPGTSNKSRASRS